MNRLLMAIRHLPCRLFQHPVLWQTKDDAMVQKCNCGWTGRKTLFTPKTFDRQTHRAAAIVRRVTDIRSRGRKRA